MNSDARDLAISRRMAAVQRMRDAEDEIEAIDAELHSDDETKRAEAERVASGEYEDFDPDSVPDPSKIKVDGGPSVVREEKDGLPPVGGIDTRVSDEGALKAGEPRPITVTTDEPTGPVVDSYGTPLEGEASAEGTGDLPLSEITHSSVEDEGTGLTSDETGREAADEGLFDGAGDDSGSEDEGAFDFGSDDSDSYADELASTDTVEADDSDK